MAPYQLFFTQKSCPIMPNDINAHFLQKGWQQQQQLMFLQCVLISREKTIVDDQIQQLMHRQSIKNVEDMYRTKQYRSSIRTDQKYIDPQLTKESTDHIQKAKAEIAKNKVQYVLVSPLKADLQTCYHLFADQQVSVFVQPSLAPRLANVSSIGQGNLSILQRFKEKPMSSKLQEDPHWYLNFGKSSSKQGQQPFNSCISEIENNENYETLFNFYQRLTELRKDLINHVGKSKQKLAIIAHRSVLQFLTSTGYHQDLQLINAVPFEYGEIKPQFIWIEGVQGEMQKSGIPFCS